MKISLVYASDRAGVIGLMGRLPWHLPRDLAHFKEVTMGKPILMGSRTWHSIGRPLPGRVNVVLSATTPPPQGTLGARSIEEALELPALMDAPEVAVIGGATLFQALAPQCDVVYRTRVETEVTGDTYFQFDPTGWVVASEETHPPDERNAHAMTFLKYVRDFLY